MLISFADVVALCPHPYVRPVFTTFGPTVIKAGNMENNMSTFAVEMKETAYLVDHLSSRALVIMDELGRGTSNIDGN